MLQILTSEEMLSKLQVIPEQQNFREALGVFPNLLPHHEHGLEPYRSVPHIVNGTTSAFDKRHQPPAAHLV